jgi:hypothetical protein
METRRYDHITFTQNTIVVGFVFTIAPIDYFARQFCFSNIENILKMKYFENFFKVLFQSKEWCV